MITGSSAVPRLAAAIVPIATPTSIQITAAPMTSERVTGAACMIWGMTLSPRLTNEVRSRLMNRCCIIRPYRIGMGRSSPNS